MAFRSDLDSLILSVLTERSLHGYEISKQIRILSSDTLKFGEGQLYPALHRLEESGFVVAEWLTQDGLPDRKVYSLTPSGHKELERHRTLWTKFVDGVNGVLHLTSQEKKTHG